MASNSGDSPTLRSRVITTRRDSEVQLNFEPKRDTYGFTVRPQHIHRYREYASIYKEEEEERLQKWTSFLEQHAKFTNECLSTEGENVRPVVSELTEQPTGYSQTVNGEKKDDSTHEKTEDPEVAATITKPVEKVNDDPEGAATKTEPVKKVNDDTGEKRSVPDTQEAKEAGTIKHGKFREVQTWAKISPSLNAIEHMMSLCIKKRNNVAAETKSTRNHLPSIDEGPSGEESEDNEKDVSNDNEMADNAGIPAMESSDADGMSPEKFLPWKEELEFLVRGGVPKDLRGEVWQAFVGVRTRWVESYYQDLLDTDSGSSDGKEHDKMSSGDNRTQPSWKKYDVPEKWKKQIEKDLPRTFPGHPALNDNGRNSLRRVLLAYARHNPSVGYCQAMNFFAGLLLLMMPEENAFWTLVGIMDDYFEGYFSQEMTESQVDQLVFEDLMRERFPKLVNHLDYLGVEVAWISGPWFLSIFVNILPWESVLRLWDVLLFEGNRVMLFRSALALMDLYGPAVVTTKDAGDAITLFQTLTGSTFDSSQLVLTACIGFLTINEDRLQELREKHRPAVLTAAEERDKGGRASKDPKGLATKLYSFKHNRSMVIEKNTEAELGDKKDPRERFDADYHAADVEEFLKGMTIDSEVDSLPDLQEQVVWLKVELCRLLEEKRSAMLRAEELEAALMEMVEKDNRRELSAMVEQLEQEVAELRQALADKKEEEKALVQVLMKVEQEQRIIEDARRFAEQEAAAQRHAVHVLQEKYDKAMADLAQMEKRAVMAESMLEATLQYESGQSKALSSPRVGRVDSPKDTTKRTGLLSFGLGWRDRNKGKSSNDVAATVDSRLKNEGSNTSNTNGDTDGHQQ
ncbi:Ypt/Rab-GAP domain of gyp1p superfamily protein [Striga hermonthica]|uniref:Ypt/Rab-GAP domain of gyp1p superfamily protein n=1 Tax=Striga hermonthica TaxID=68872 RepID=A0A9N7N9J0_STRHE|nr:Ypt/Rab-GAP domain of gyp1p superfamily protein [Striga hermonthica]